MFMNTNPNAIKILCYGDSNTWGQKPDKSGRYPANVRWTGRLQESLGDDYYVLEEGLGSRTTDLDYVRRPGRNGKTYLIPCLGSHSPVDVVILMLGTNDLKTEYRRDSDDVANAINGLVDDINEFAKDRSGGIPKVILVSPIEINSDAPRFAEFYTGYYDDRAMRESHKLADSISRIAKQRNCKFLDASTVAKPGEDGVHFSLESEEQLATALSTIVNELSGRS